MDIGESNKKTKGKTGDKAGSLSARAKAISWPTAISEFLLDWYLEKKLELPHKVVFKIMHHTTCTSTINAKYGTTYTVDHVVTLGVIKRLGDLWLGISMREANDRGVLNKPIQFFDKLQELFSGSSANGSFMQDPCTAAESDNDEVEKLDMLNGMSAYDETTVPEGQDLDKLESDSDDCQEVAALSASASQVSSSNIVALKPNKKSFKRIGKPKTLPPSQSDRAKKSKSKSSPALHADNDIDVLLTSALVGLRETLASSIQTVAPKDPNDHQWDMLKNVALTPDDRMTVGIYLCKPEFQVHRSFLVSMVKNTFKHLPGGELVILASSDLAVHVGCKSFRLWLMGVFLVAPFWLCYC